MNLIAGFCSSDVILFARPHSWIPASERRLCPPCVSFNLGVTLMSKRSGLREATGFPPPIGRRNQLIRLQPRRASGPLPPDQLSDSSSASRPPPPSPRRSGTQKKKHSDSRSDVEKTSTSAFNLTDIRRQIGGEMADDPPPLVSGYLSAAKIPSTCHGGGQPAFQRHRKDGLSHALNCLFEGNE